MPLTLQKCINRLSKFLQRFSMVTEDPFFKIDVSGLDHGRTSLDSQRRISILFLKGFIIT